MNAKINATSAIPIPKIALFVISSAFDGLRAIELNNVEMIIPTAIAAAAIGIPNNPIAINFITF